MRTSSCSRRGPMAEAPAPETAVNAFSGSANALPVASTQAATTAAKIDKVMAALAAAWTAAFAPRATAFNFSCSCTCTDTCYDPPSLFPRQECSQKYERPVVIFQAVVYSRRRG